MTDYALALAFLALALLVIVAAWWRDERKISKEEAELRQRIDRLIAQANQSSEDSRMLRYLVTQNENLRKRSREWMN